MHHLTPNGIAKIALFIWAMKCQGVNLDIKAFCGLHEMHTQFWNKPVDGKKVIFYFGYCSFEPVWNAKQIPRLRRTSGMKTGINIGSMILFLFSRKEMNPGRQ